MKETVHVTAVGLPVHILAMSRGYSQSPVLQHRSTLTEHKHWLPKYLLALEDVEVHRLQMQQKDNKNMSPKSLLDLNHPRYSKKFILPRFFYISHQLQLR